MILYFLLHDIVPISILPDPHFVHDLSQPCRLRTDSTNPDLPSSNLTFKFFWSTKLIRPLTPAPLASSRTLSILESGIPRLENMEYVWRTWRTRKRYKTWRTSSVPRLRCFGKQLRIGKRQATYRALPPSVLCTSILRAYQHFVQNTKTTAPFSFVEKNKFKFSLHFWKRGLIFSRFLNVKCFTWQVWDSLTIFQMKHIWVTPKKPF